MLLLWLNIHTKFDWQTWEYYIISAYILFSSYKICNNFSNYTWKLANSYMPNLKHREDLYLTKWQFLLEYMNNLNK